MHNTLLRIYFNLHKLCCTKAIILDFSIIIYKFQFFSSLYYYGFVIDRPYFKVYKFPGSFGGHINFFRFAWIFSFRIISKIENERTEFMIRQLISER
jgi:hypothetical protein